MLHATPIHEIQYCRHIIIFEIMVIIQIIFSKRTKGVDLTDSRVNSHVYIYDSSLKVSNYSVEILLKAAGFFPTRLVRQFLTSFATS